MDELGFRSSDGIDVSYRRWQAEGEPKAAVLVAHGMSEHSGRYQRLANALTAAGYAVYAPDHRGHGRTSASTGVGRIGPAGTLIGIDRDPNAEERFAELSAEVTCQTRFIRADFASGG